MARGKSRRVMYNNVKNEKAGEVDRGQGLLEEIESHWATMPLQLRPFLLKNSNHFLSLSKFATF